MKNLILLLSLTIVLLLSGCGEKNGTEKTVPDTVKLLDLSSVPAARETGTTPETLDNGQSVQDAEASSAEENILDFYRDDFDSFDPEFWTVIEEKTGKLIPEQAHFQNGIMSIEAAAADRNPLFHSKPIEAVRGDIIRIKRRALIHPGNEYANISFSLYSTDGTDMSVSKDIKREAIAGIQYLDFQYDQGRYPITTGVLMTVPGYKDSGEFKTMKPLFDTWIDEEIEYRTDSGMVKFTINGETAELQGSPMTLPYFRVYMNAYGWYTGHRVDVDYLEVIVESPGNETPGVAAVENLAAETIEPSVERRVVETETGITVSIPGLASDSPETIEIKSVKYNDNTLVSGVDVSLGNIHKFDGAVKITLPVPDGIVPEGESPSKYLYPVSFDPETDRWVPEPALYGENDVTILSSHLSSFALKLGQGMDLDYSKVLVTTKKEAIESAWSSMTGNLDWVAQKHSYASMVSDNPFLEVLETPLGTVGTGFAIIDIAKNMAQGEDMKAGLGAVKLVSSWALGKFATLGTQIAGIGTFFIDYSLNTLATETLAAQYAAFDKAYRAYYKSEGKSVYEWYGEIKTIISAAATPEEASERINESINEYVKYIWEDEAAFEGYLADIRGHGWTGDAGQTEEIKRRLEEKYKAELRQTLKPAVNRALEWIENQAYEEQFKAAYKAQEILKQDIRYWVDVFGNRNNDKLEVVVLNNDTPMFTVKPSKNGAVDFLGFTTLSEFFNGPRPTHILLQGYLQIDEEKTVPVSMKQPLVWDSFSPTIEFDIDRSKYIEEKAKDTETEDEDSVEAEEPPAEEEYTVSFEDVKEWITPEEIAETNYSIFELAGSTGGKVETDPPSITIEFSSLSELGRAPKDPETGEYLSFISISDGNGNGATASYRNDGYLSYAEYIPETGMGKSVSGDGMGNKISETYYMNGIQHGPYREFYEGEKIYIENFYKNGVLDGPSREYYENGQLQHETNYVNGEPQGLYQSFYENGQLESRSMDKGWADWGPYETYYENGQLSLKGQYLSYEKANEERMGGTRTGYWQSFYESGVLSSEEWYTKDGSFIESKTYNEAGWMDSHTFEKDGKTISVSYDSNGNKTGETEY